MAKVMVDGKVEFTGNYKACEKYCKEMGYLVYNGICWDYRYADVAIV